MEITKPSITRLARKAGVKSVSDECFPYLRSFLVSRVESVLKSAIQINGIHGTKTMMPDDVYEALAIRGENLTASTLLGKTTVGK